MKKYSIQLALVTLLIFSVFVWNEWRWLVAYILAINLSTCLAYIFDKAISHTNTTRIPEKLLHILALLGGSPAALLGQQFLRHKTRKHSFLIVYWCIVLVQVALLAWYFWDDIR